MSTFDDMLKEQFAKGATPEFLKEFMYKAYAQYQADCKAEEEQAAAEETYANAIGEYLTSRHCEDVEAAVNAIVDYTNSFLDPSTKEKTNPSIRLRVDGKDVSSEELANYFRKAFPWF